MDKIGAMLTSFITQNKFGFALFLMSLGLAGCEVLNPLAPLPASKTVHRETTPVLHGEKQTFGGKVVLVTAGYRFRLADSTEDVRLSRAKRASEFENDEISLRKYYEKTLTIRGKRDGEWIWDAEIVGQWNRPGESQGPNVLAPPVGR
jgi:hypothetical protein